MSTIPVASASRPVTPQDLVAEAKRQIREVSTTQAQEMLATATVVDVREPDEYANGHLPGALLLPRGVLEFKIGTVPECIDKSAPYLVYCRTSGRAALATVQLQKIGYSNVVSMAGGYEAWSKEGRPSTKA